MKVARKAIAKLDATVSARVGSSFEQGRKPMAGDDERFDPDTAIFAKAVEIFGSEDEAELWLRRPAIGLNGECPIDLLKSPEGKRVIADFLARLEYGVYQ